MDFLKTNSCGSEKKGTDELCLQMSGQNTLAAAAAAAAASTAACENEQEGT